MGLTSRGKPQVDFKMAEGKKILRYKHLYRNCIHTKTGINLKKKMALESKLNLTNLSPAETLTTLFIKKAFIRSNETTINI